MKIQTWIIAMVLMWSASSSGQATEKTLRGTVTIKASGGSVAVHGKTGSPDTDFLFCVDQDRSAAAQRLEFTGPARVMYRTAPIQGLPAGVVISGPESVANTLAVVADTGKAWIFVAKGETPLFATAETTTVTATVVRRLDWAAQNGMRRGTEISGCLLAAG